MTEPSDSKMGHLASPRWSPLPHLAGVDATLCVASTEHLGLNLIPVEVGAVADIIANDGDASLLEHLSLLAWGYSGKAGWHWGAWTPPSQSPLPRGGHRQNSP